MATDAVVFGCKGMLARALAGELSARGVKYVGFDLPECDMTRAADVARVFTEHRPDVVYNCAAFTKVDLCEEQEELAGRVNGECVRTLAEMCKQFDSRLIHISTDFVFDGMAKRPYRPDDRPAPLSAYGRSKLLGEKLLQEVRPAKWAIIRTAWLYGVGGASFPRTMVELARKGVPLKVVADQVGSPTYTVDLAKAMVDLAQAEASGIFHCTNAGETSWHGFAVQTLKEFEIDYQVEAISTQEYLKMRPKQAKRPAYSGLDRGSLEAAVGRKMRPWGEALKEFKRAVDGNGGF